MGCASWVIASGVVMSVAACSLTTSLSGLSSGDVSAAGDGGDASSGADARSEASTGDEGGTGSEGGTNEGGVVGYRELVLADAPLAYYRLGDQAGTAKDEVGGHDGVYKGTVTHAGGAIAGDTNGAAVFDGTSGYVEVGEAFAFLDTAPFTIEAWASPVSGGSDPACIASKSFAQGGLAGNLTDGYTFYLDSGTNLLNVARYRSGADDTVNGTTIENDKFSHVVATYDGATVTIWLNGVSVASGPSTRALASNGKPFTLGASRGGIYCFFRGTLDEVAIYGAALHADRVGAHYKAGLGK